MFFRKILVALFVILMMYGLFIGFDRNDSAAYRQGFIDGQRTATTVESSQASKAAPESVAEAPGALVYVRDHRFFLPPFAFLLCMIPLLFFGLSALGFGRHGRRYHHRGMWGPCGSGRRAWKHGTWQGKPWQEWDDEPHEKSPEDIDDGPYGPVMQA